MPLAKTAADQLKSDFTVARKKALSFGFSLAAKIEDSVFLTHRVRKAEQLGKEARKQTKSAKLIYGSMTVDGKVLNLQCVEPPKESFAKKIKTFLRGNGIKVKVKLFDMNMQPLEEDGEPEEEEGQEAAAAAGAPDPAAEAWAARKAELEPQVLRYISNQRLDHSKVKAGWAVAVEAGGDQGDPSYALKVAGNVEALMAAGGGAPEQRGEAKQGPEAQWDAAKRKMEPHVLEALKLKTGDTSKIQAVWAFAHGKAEATPPDYAAAMKALTPLAKLIAEARAGTETEAEAAAKEGQTGVDERKQKLQAAWETGAARVRPLVEARLKQNAAGNDKLKQAWMFAQDKAENKEFAAAVEALKRIAAVVAKPAVDQGKKPDPGKIDPSEHAGAAETAAAKSELVTEIKTALAAVAAAAKAVGDFADTAPATWQARLDSARKALSDVAGKDGGSIAAAIEDAKTKTGEVQAELATALAKRETWLKERAVFLARMKILENHPMKAVAPIGGSGGKIKEIKDALAAAETAAKEKLKYDEGKDELARLRGLADTAEVYADELAHYTEIAKGRKVLFDNLPASPPGSAHQSLIDALAAVKTLWAEAEAKKAEGKFKDGVAKLNEMRKAHAKYLTISDLHGQYGHIRSVHAADINAFKNGLAELEAKVRPVEGAGNSIKTGLVDLVKPLEDKYAASTVEKAGYSRAIEDLNRDYNVLDRGYNPRKAAAKLYVENLVKFNKALNEAPMNLKTHDGADGIREYIELMERDLKDAKEAAGKYKFGLAEKLLKATEEKWPVWEQMAKDYKAYKDKYDEVNPKFQEVINDLEWTSGTFFDAADLADTMNAAGDARLAKDYKRAKAELEAAEALIAYVKTLKETDRKKTGALQDKDGKLANAGKEFAPAYKVFTDLRAIVAGADKDGIFKSEIQRADGEAKKAQDASAAEQPDAAAAARDLGAAIGILEPLALNAERAKMYKASLETVEQEIAALKALPADQKPAAKDDWEAMEKLVQQAKEAVKPPGFDFQQGEALMNDAMRKSRDARKKAELNPKIQAILDHAAGPVKKKEMIEAIAGGTATFDKEHKLLADYLKEIADAKKAGDYVKAYETAKEAKRQCEPIDKLTKEYEAAKDEYENEVKPLKLKYGALDQVSKDLKKDRLAELEQEYQNLMKSHDFAAAKTLCLKIMLEIWVCTGHQKTYEPWKTSRAAAAAKIKELDDNKNAAVAEALEALGKEMAAAEEKAGKLLYAEACKLTDPVPDRVAKLLVTAQQYKDWETARAKAGAEMAKLEGKDGIASLRERLENKSKNADTRKAAGDYAGAKRLLDQIPGDVAAALKVDNRNEQLNGLSAEVGGLDGGDAEAVRKAVADARQLAAKLAQDANKEFVLPRLVPVKTALDKADAAAATDGAAAKKLLAAVLVTCKRLQAGLWHFDQLKTIVARATSRAGELDAAHTGKDHIAPDAAKLKARIDMLLPDAVETGETAPGFAAAETVFADIVQLRAFRDGFKEYKDRAEGFDQRLAELEKHPHRYAVKKQLDAIRAALTAAAGKAAGNKFPEAQAELDKVEKAALDAEIEVRMRNNEVPKPEQLKALMQREDGIDKLDAIVKGTKDSEGLDEVTKRKVLKAVFDARFGCELVAASDKTLSFWADMEDKGPNIARMYEMMSLLPPADTATNDSLMLYWTSATSGGSSFNYADKKIILREGNTVYSNEYRFGDGYEVGDEVEPECVPKNTDPVVALDWNTLHEVGHAVDDQKKYMVTNGEKLAGWKFHFGDLSEVGEAIAKHYEYDKAYTLAYIAGNADPPLPRPPDGIELEVWERNRIKAVAHIDDCREGRHPWMSAAGAKKLAVQHNGEQRIFHEAYSGGRWVSYKADARKQAITGYQFRAPAEWFSELYSAYHCDKLQESHPAVKWLSQISPKRKTT